MHVPAGLLGRHRRPILLAAALALSSVAFVTASPVSAAPCPSTPCVVVHLVSTVDGEDTTETFVKTKDEIAALAQDDLVAPKYYTRKSLKGGLSKSPRPSHALSLHSLLANLDDDPARGDSVRFSETPASGGVPVVLDKPELGDPDDPDSPFVDQLAPAIYVSGSKIGYVRPLRDQKTDVNAGEVFTTGTLELTFHTTGKLLEPVVNVGSTSVDTKTKNRFSVTFGQSTGTRIVKYAWSFGDGAGGGRTLEKPTHTYAKKGTYDVVVAVRGSNGSYGRSDAKVMTVGKPPKAPAPATGGTGGTGGYGSGGFGTPPPYDPGTGEIPDSDMPPTSDDTPPDSDLLDATSGLEQVEGFVLTGAGAETGDEIPGTPTSTTATPTTSTSTRTRVLQGVLGGLAAALLLGAGAASETRWLRNKIAHLRGQNT